MKPNAQLSRPGWVDYALWGLVIFILIGAGFLVGVTFG